MAKRAACVYFFGALAWWSIFCLLLAPVYLLLQIMLGKKAVYAARYGTWLYARIFLIIARPVLTVRLVNGTLPSICGHAYGDKSKSGRILILNHQSFFDSYLIACQPERNICQIVRSWPFKKLFFFSPVMRLARYIESEGHTPEETIAACERELRNGTTLVCFPEGHRSRDGKLRRFHSGIFVAAVNANVPIFPIVIHNSGIVCPPGHFRFTPGEIVISFLPPVYPESFKYSLLPHLAMSRQIRKAMGDTLGDQG